MIYKSYYVRHHHHLNHHHHHLQVSLSDHEALLATFLVESKPSPRGPSSAEVSFCLSNFHNDDYDDDGDDDAEDIKNHWQGDPLVLRCRLNFSNFHDDHRDGCSNSAEMYPFFCPILVFSTFILISAVSSSSTSLVQWWLEWRDHLLFRTNHGISTRPWCGAGRGKN